MIVTFEDPGDQDLRLSEAILAKLDRCKRTIPRANRAPKPRTTPYPQPTSSGGAIGIGSCYRQLLKRGLSCTMSGVYCIYVSASNREVIWVDPVREEKARYLLNIGEKCDEGKWAKEVGTR